VSLCVEFQICIAKCNTKCNPRTCYALKYGAGQSAPQFEMWSNAKAEEMEKQGMKITAMHLSNEVVDDQMQSLVNVNGVMQKCCQCGWSHAKVGGECGMSTFVGEAPRSQRKNWREEGTKR
jgi:hypothetical protein